MTKKTDWRSRPLITSDQAFLWDMLFIALWDAPEDPRRPRTVLDHPVIKRLAENWGRSSDFGLIAIDPDTNTDIGAIWTRLDGYDQLDGWGCDHPCLGIAVIDSHQNRGVGSFLLAEFIAQLGTKTPGLRLGVHPKNAPAKRLYEKFGFAEYAIGHRGYPQMKLDFNDLPQGPE